MGDDIRQMWVSNNYPMEGIVHEHDGQSHVDDGGIEWTRTDGFNQVAKYPLADAGEQQLLQYKFPFDRIDSLVDLMKPALPRKRFSTELPISANLSVHLNAVRSIQPNHPTPTRDCREAV